MYKYIPRKPFFLISLVVAIAAEVYGIYLAFNGWAYQCLLPLLVAALLIALSWQGLTRTNRR